MLRTLGNSRLVTTSIAWLFIVPIAAKLLAPFAGQHTLDLSWFDPDLDEPITVTIALPFSWQRFYLMSWLFVIGQAVYWFACPEIVRKYPNFGAYRTEHATEGRLTQYARTAVFGRGRAVLGRIAAAIKEWFGDPVTEPITSADNRKKLYARLAQKLGRLPENQNERHNDVFDATLAAEQHARRLWFSVSGTFFSGGLVLFGSVVIEGVIEVGKLL